MHITEIQAFCKRQNEASEKEKAEFKAALQAQQDEIVTLEDLRAKFSTLDKPARKALYNRLNSLTALYPGAIASGHVMWEPFLSLRAKVEYFRGVVRNEKGQILRSPEQLAARRALLAFKRADAEQRIKNIDSELETIKTALGE